MKLTKSKAKEILLYLLNRNADYLDMSKIDNIDDKDHAISYIECVDNRIAMHTIEYCNFAYLKDDEKLNYRYFGNAASLQSIVKAMFNAANHGYDVMSCIYDEDCPVLYANESIEKVMIEMELKKD